MYISVSMRKWILSSKKILAYIHLFPIPKDFRVLLMAQQVKNPPAMQGDSGLTPGLGRSPGGGNGILLQYSYLKNPTDRGAWWATVHSVSRVALDWATKQAKQSISRTRVVISGLLKFVNSLSAPETVFFHINYASHVLISRSNSDTSFAGTTQWEHSDSALLRLWHSLLSSCLHEPTCLGSDPLEQSVLQHGHSLHPARPLTPPCYPCMDESSPHRLGLQHSMLSCSSFTHSDSGTPLWGTVPQAPLYPARILTLLCLTNDSGLQGKGRLHRWM